MLSADIQLISTGRVTRHRARDLSETGMKIDGAAKMPIASEILVSLGALQAIPATVVWVRDGFAGLRFAAKIDLQQARAKAVIRPTDEASKQIDNGSQPQAGWIAELNDAYRRPNRAGHNNLFPD